MLHSVNLLNKNKEQERRNSTTINECWIIHANAEGKPFADSSEAVITVLYVSKRFCLPDQTPLPLKKIVCFCF